MTVVERVERRGERHGQFWRKKAWALMAPLRQNLHKQRRLILPQLLAAQGLMRVLMKPRNTGLWWTREELRQIRSHLRTLVWLIPALLVFLPPGGALLLPILAEILDRRQIPRG
jgi:hypothetical protein